MSKTTRALEPIGRTVIFSAACRPSAVGIQWMRVPRDDEIKADDYMVQRCGESVGWWMGDLIVMLCKREGADLTLSAYAAQYARARGINEQTAIAYAGVAQFFPVSKRLNRPIAWGHHHIIWGWESGKGLSICLKWLKRAQRGDKGKSWSTGRLRSELADNSRHTGQATEPPPPTGDFDEMAKIESWSATKLSLVKKIGSDEAKEMLLRFESTIAFVDALRARANR